MLPSTIGAAVLAFSLLVTASATAAADSWAETAGDDPDFAASKAICRTAEAVALPVSRTSAAKNCDSSALLYGIGLPSDAVAARACAVEEMKQNNNATAGAATLATIFANGSGVRRDYGIALGYACRIDGAPAEMDARVKHLARLKTEQPGVKPFDLCDDVTSGMLGGFCSERTAALADAKRDSDLAALRAKLEPQALMAFDALRRAEQAFVRATSENEVDVSGTGRVSFIVESQQAHQTDFMATLHDVLSGTLAKAPSAGNADRQLNATYAKVMSTKDTSGWGTVEKPGIKAAQRAWLAYRDAFLAFERIAAPTLPPATLAEVLTSRRTKELQSFLQ